MKRISSIMLLIIISVCNIYGQSDDGVCNPVTVAATDLLPSVYMTNDNGDIVFCTDGSSDSYYLMSDNNGSLENNEYLIENSSDSSLTFTTDGMYQLNGQSFTENDQIKITAVTFNLEDINTTLGTIASLCSLTPLSQEICDSLVSLVYGNNDGNPGINDMNEALFFVSSLAGQDLTSLSELVYGLDAINTVVGAYNLSICYGFSETIVLTAIDCSTNCGNTVNNIAASFCENATYDLPDGSTANEGGTYSFSFDGQNGCDSSVNISLLTNDVYSSDEIVVEIYAGETYTLADNTEITEAGTYSAVLTGINGCDSILNYNIDVLVGIQTFEESISFDFINNKAHIKFNNNSNNAVNLMLVNLNGLIVENYILLTSDAYIIDLSKFESGIYCFYLFDEKNIFSKNVAKI